MYMTIYTDMPEGKIVTIGERIQLFQMTKGKKTM